MGRPAWFREPPPQSGALTSLPRASGLQAERGGAPASSTGLLCVPGQAMEMRTGRAWGSLWGAWGALSLEEVSFGQARPRVPSPTSNPTPISLQPAACWVYRVSPSESHSPRGPRASFTHSCIHSSVHSFIHQFIHSFIHLFIY